jgi:hypothetical protein
MHIKQSAVVCFAVVVVITCGPIFSQDASDYRFVRSVDPTDAGLIQAAEQNAQEKGRAGRQGRPERAFGR